MTVKIEFEFKSADEAILALAKLSSAANLPPAPAPEDGRKPRNDIGKPRKPYGPRDKGQGAGATPRAAEAQKPGDGSTGVTESRTAQPAAASSTVPDGGGPAASAPGTIAGAAQVGSTTAPAPDPKSVVQAQVQALTEAADGKQPSDADLVAASEALAGAKGLQTVIDLLARFGVKRGRDLPVNRRADYIKRAGEVAAGAAI